MPLPVNIDVLGADFYLDPQPLGGVLKMSQAERFKDFFWQILPLHFLTEAGFNSGLSDFLRRFQNFLLPGLCPCRRVAVSLKHGFQVSQFVIRAFDLHLVTPILVAYPLFLG